MTLQPDVQAPPPTPADDPFYYGWRWVPHTVNGQTELHAVPLTLEDVLHPQMEDVVNQTDDHYRVCHYLYTVLRATLRPQPTMLVLHDVLIEWATPGMRGHAPDIVVFADVRERPRHRSFNQHTDGGTPVLIMEVTSESTRMLDLKPKRPGQQSKYHHYERIGVPYYVVVDNARYRGTRMPPFFGYELQQGRYRALTPDQQGRVWIPPVGLWLGPFEGDIAWFDQQGRAIGDYEEVSLAMHEAEQRAKAEHAARLKAEEQAREEQKQTEAERTARLRAEEQAREEQKQTEAEHAARLKAEQETDAERTARRALEQRLRELEAQLREQQDEQDET